MTQTKILVVCILLLSIGCSKKQDVDKLNFLNRGNDAYIAGDIDVAISFYNEALMKDSLFVDAWNNNGLALMKKKEYDGAIACFERAIALKQNYAEAILNNTKANLAVHQYFAALEYIDALDKLWPDSSITYFTKGLIEAEQGYDNKALKSFRQAYLLDSTNAESLVNIANIYYHSHQLDSATFYLKKSIALNTNLAGAYNLLAMVNLEQDDLKAALGLIDIAYNLDKADPYILNNRGLILLKLGNLAAAEESIITSMKMDPYNAWVYRNLGLLRGLQGNDIEEERLLLKALEMNKNIENFYEDLSKIYIRDNKFDELCHLLERAPLNKQITLLQQTYCQQ